MFDRGIKCCLHLKDESEDAEAKMASAKDQPCIIYLLIKTIQKKEAE